MQTPDPRPFDSLDRGGSPAKSALPRLGSGLPSPPPSPTTEGAVLVRNLYDALDLAHHARRDDRDPPTVADLPSELLDIVFALVGRNVYASASANQAQLVALAGVCRRWRYRLQPVLDRFKACTSIRQVERLHHAIVNTPSPALLATLSIVLDMGSPPAMKRTKEAHLELQRVADLVCVIVGRCRDSLRSLELGTDKALDDLGWLFHPRLCRALEALDLMRFSLVANPPTETSRTGEGEDHRTSSSQVVLDADIVFGLVAAWPNLQSLVLHALLRAPSGCAIGLAPPKCNLRSLWLNSWYELGHGEQDTFEPVEWILSNSVGTLREFRCSQGFFFQPSPTITPPRSALVAGGGSELATDEDDDEGCLPSLTELLNRHGHSLRSLDLGLFVCTDADVDLDDFGSLLNRCPSVTSYTHGDIVIDDMAVDILSRSNLRQLRIYYEAAGLQSVLFRYHLRKGNFRDLRAFHVVVDREISDVEEPELRGALDGIKSIGMACAERGIEFLHAQTRRFTTM